MVNHDGRDGTALDPLVWSAGALRKRRRLVHAVRDRAFLPGPPGIWHSEWFQVPTAAICAEDIAHWPYTPLAFWLSGSLFWALFTGLLEILTLVWVVFLMLSCSFCMSFGLVRGFLWRRLTLVIFVQGAQFLVSAVPFGPGIWRSCRFICSLMRSLCLLPGGLRRFVPCSIGANHCRLRHIGWEKCGHGLTSRPRESASELFLNELFKSLSLSS